MASAPMVGYKRSAPDAPHTFDDDGSQPERGKELRQQAQSLIRLRCRGTKS
jgi:hypothetical protein